MIIESHHCKYEILSVSYFDHKFASCSELIGLNWGFFWEERKDGKRQKGRFFWEVKKKIESEESKKEKRERKLEVGNLKTEKREKYVKEYDCVFEGNDKNGKNLIN